MIFNNDRKSKIDEIISAQAKLLNIDFQVLKELYQGKACPKYGSSEQLHVRKVRGGKLVVFNISEKYRGEKISEGRKKTKDQKAPADASTNENNKI
jgi:hypothetical protein